MYKINLLQPADYIVIHEGLNPISWVIRQISSQYIMHNPIGPSGSYIHERNEPGLLLHANDRFDILENIQKNAICQQ